MSSSPSKNADDAKGQAISAIDKLLNNLFVWSQSDQQGATAEELRCRDKLAQLLRYRADRNEEDVRFGLSQAYIEG